MTIPQLVALLTFLGVVMITGIFLAAISFHKWGRRDDAERARLVERLKFEHGIEDKTKPSPAAPPEE